VLLLKKSRKPLIAQLLLLLLSGSATCRAQQALNVGGGYPLQLGTAWYPEQWPESRWNEDLRLMEAAHIHFVRVGEFAWSRFEPSEGNYDFAWMHRAVRLAEQHKIRVVMGTPTAAPPA
jgi:beta-galactosidase